ncbi:FliH/SctL family protein [uncultured Microbacterium sp.]|uniref:FliH/SctL family protein n=1 Tax=uncultured Microbacterium sp. TaxID=191216 RepID=UPI0025D856B2|nr:FliH/SctL family protein [uncultured Microbacterium sp.]
MSESVFTPLVLPRVGEERTDARTVADKARARGYADGFAEGRREARAELERERLEADERFAAREAAAQAAHRAALSGLGEARARLEDGIAAIVASDLRRLEELAVEMAAAILGAEMSDAARSAAHAVRRAAAQTPRSTWVRVRLNERDVRTLGTLVGPSLPEGVEVVVGADVDPGGAVVRIAHGSVDTRVAAALERARAALSIDENVEEAP